MVVLGLGEDGEAYLPISLESSLGDFSIPAAITRMIRTVEGRFGKLQTRGRRW